MESLIEHGCGNPVNEKNYEHVLGATRKLDKNKSRNPQNERKAFATGHVSPFSPFSAERLDCQVRRRFGRGALGMGEGGGWITGLGPRKVKDAQGGYKFLDVH